MKNKEPEKLQYFGHSSVGKRANNEDTYEILQLSAKKYFLVVADGMGGYEGGETASQLAIEASLEILGHIPDEEITIQQGKRILEEIFTTADKKIAAAKMQWPALSNMGTTLTCALVIGNRYIWGNIGDSRIYILRKNHIQQITRDHTYLEEYGGKHKDHLPQKVKQQYGNTLTKALDGNHEKPDIYPYPDASKQLLPGQWFLLCSDGLLPDSIESNPRLMLRIVQKSPDLQAACHKLIDKASKEGSTDNITVVLATYGKIRNKNHGKTLMAALIAILVILIGLFLYQNRSSSSSSQTSAPQNAATPSASIPVVSMTDTTAHAKMDTAESLKMLATEKKHQIDSLQLELKDIKWYTPLEKSSVPRQGTHQVTWEDFPHQRILKHYQVELLYHDSLVECIQTNETGIYINQFTKAKNNIYTIRLKAVTSLGTITGDQKQLEIIP